VVSLLLATKLTRSCSIKMLEQMETVKASVNDIPFGARVAIVLHSTSLRIINGLVVVKSAEFKGFTVSMTFQLLRQNPRLEHLVLYEAIPSLSYTELLFTTLKQSCPSLKSFYSEADHNDVSLIKDFLRNTATSLEEVSFPNSQLHSLLSGDSGENFDENKWSLGPSLYGLHHGTESWRKVQMWRKGSSIASRSAAAQEFNHSAPCSSYSPPPSPTLPLRATLRGMSFAKPSSYSPASSPVIPFKFSETGRHSPLALSSGPRSLRSLSISTDFITQPQPQQPQQPQQQQDLYMQDQPLFMSRSTGVLREGTTSA